MALPFEELEAVTNDYFMIDDRKAADLWFKTSWLLNYLLMQKKGIFEQPSSGRRIRVPLEYDGQEAEFYAKGDTLSSDDRESLNAAYFEWKHAYSNATVYDVDLGKIGGDEGMISLITQRLSGAQRSLTKLLASSIYDGPTGASKRLTGLLACCNETSTLAYGGIAEDDLVAADGTKPWEGKVTSTVESINFPVLRTMRLSAHVRDGAGGDINLIVTTKTLFDAVCHLLQVQQRYVENDDMAKAGFTGVKFEGMTLYSDDFCPSGYSFGLNTNHIGFVVHREKFFVRSKWSVIPDSPEDKTMKFYWWGNMVVNNRQAHIAHSNLS